MTKSTAFFKLKCVQCHKIEERPAEECKGEDMPYCKTCHMPMTLEGVVYHVGRKPEGPRTVVTFGDPVHDGTDFPHGISCPACRQEVVCNHCGTSWRDNPRILRNGQLCTNGRCPNCCRKNCKHKVAA